MYTCMSLNVSEFIHVDGIPSQRALSAHSSVEFNNYPFSGWSFRLKLPDKMPICF